MMDTITVRQGADRDWPVQIADYAGQALTGIYTGSEPLSLQVWSGGSRAPLALSNSTVTWTSGTAGTLKLHWDAIDTAALAPGRYNVVVTLTDAVSTVDCYAAELEITAGPGTATAPKVYATLADCRKECAWILDAVGPDANIPNSLEPQLEQARLWTEDICHRHYRTAGTYVTNANQTYTTILSFRRTGARSPWLQQQLDAGYLMLTEPIVRMNALYAVAMALRNCVGSRGETPYEKLSWTYLALAEDAAKTTTAELDLNGDGYSEIQIDLGFIDSIAG